MSDDPHTLERLRTRDGVDLAADLRDTARRSAVAVITHPHPRYGGDRHNLVTATLFEGLPGHGVCTLRFDFRGAGGSGGVHGGGLDERLDVRAALDRVTERWPGVPIVLMGYSFGADVALAVDHDDLAGWFAVAPPLTVGPADEYLAPADPRPTLLAVPEHDQFRPPAAARSLTADWVNTSIVEIPGCDHFCTGATNRVLAHALTFLDELDLL